MCSSSWFHNKTQFAKLQKTISKLFFWFLLFSSPLSAHATILRHSPSHLRQFFISYFSLESRCIHHLLDLLFFAFIECKLDGIILVAFFGFFFSGQSSLSLAGIICSSFHCSHPVEVWGKNKKSLEVFMRGKVWKFRWKISGN